MDYLQDLLRFLKEVSERWPDIVLGGVIGGLWVLFEKFTRREVSMKTFLIIVGVSLFFAMFGAWREQFNKARPSLISNAPNLGWSGEHPSGSAIYFILQITNRGPTTMVDIQPSMLKIGKRKEIKVKASISQHGRSVQNQKRRT